MARSKSMKKTFVMSFVYPTIIFGVLVLSLVSLLIIYLVTKADVVLYILMIDALLALGGFALVFTFIMRHQYKVYYEGLFETTKRNFKSLYDSSSELEKYPEYPPIDEINELNDEIARLKVAFDNSTLVTPECDYSKIDFDYVPGLDHVVTLKSLSQQLNNIIFFSNSYRNALCEIFYDLDIDTLTDEEIKNVFDLLDNYLKDYDDKIYALNENKKSVFVYIPRIDTFSTIRERLIMLMQNISVCKDTKEGLTTINARAVLVAYPYSDTSEMMHDLNYAKQEGKIINIYLPNRAFGTTYNNNIVTESVNLNIVSKALESLGELRIDGSSKEEYVKRSEDCIRNFQSFFGVDEAGVILLDLNTFDYYSMSNLSKYQNPLLKVGSIIDKDFVKMMDEDKDNDNSYYFSDRSHANNTLGRYLDKYRIHSGFYYVIKDNNDTVLGVIYFFNRNRDFVINSYLREGLVLFANRISNFIVQVKNHTENVETFDMIDNILLLSHYGTYQIDKYTHEIVKFTSNLKSYFPNIAYGKECFRALYGNDRPCAKCPLNTSKKMLEKYREYQIETSLNLAKDNNSRYINMLTRQITSLEEGIQERYNTDFLVNSYPSLVEDVQNCYSAKGRGHLLILRIDNLDELYSQYGSENTTVAIRTFLSNIKNKFGGLNNIYYFNSQAFGVLCQDLGQIDIVNRCEAIYEISKQAYFDETVEGYKKLKVTYLPMVYPSSYPTAYDFLRNAQRFFDSGKYEPNNDLIYFEENGYVRSASKTTFMLSVIDDKFGNSTFTALLQPYLRAKDRSMYGVEMLLRLTDDYRKITFNPDELIKIAAKNGKMQVISDSLINFAGNLYQKQGSSIFKVFGLKRFSINIDYSYFQDEDSIPNLVKLMDSFKFPKEFIAFEIPEWDVKDHANEYKKVVEQLRKENVVFVCDQYSEKHISLERLNDIGFTEIKIGRALGGFVDSDPQKAAALKSIMERAKALNMQTSVVGLENHNQYEFIRDIDDQAFVQGFYFFKPLDKNALINALRTMNTSN